MHHIKLILFGVVLVAIVVFGTIFWGDFWFNQQELSNTPMGVTTSTDGLSPVSPVDSSGLSKSDAYDDIEKDLDQTSLEIDSDMAELESELQGL